MIKLNPTVSHKSLQHWLWKQTTSQNNVVENSLIMSSLYEWIILLGYDKALVVQKFGHTYIKLVEFLKQINANYCCCYTKYIIL